MFLSIVPFLYSKRTAAARSLVSRYRTSGLLLARVWRQRRADPLGERLYRVTVREIRYRVACESCRL